jgi:hypothetical protein
MPKFAPAIHSRSAFLMLALLLVTLWVSAAHLHDMDDPHPQTACSICMQLQAAQFSGSAVLSVPPTPADGELLADETFADTGTRFYSPYQGRAPPITSS